MANILLLILFFLTLWNYCATQWIIETDITKLRNDYENNKDKIDMESSEICNRLSFEKKLSFCKVALKQKTINEILNLEYDDQTADSETVTCEEKKIFIVFPRISSLPSMNPEGFKFSVNIDIHEQKKTYFNIIRYQKMYKCPVKQNTDYYENMYVAQSYQSNGVFLFGSSTTVESVYLIAHITNIDFQKLEENIIEPVEAKSILSENKKDT